MTDQGPGSGLNPMPPPPPLPSRRRHPVLTALMIIIGVVALLPGVCAIFFMIALPGGGDGTMALLWLVCLAISAGGIALIVRAVRR